MLDIFLTILPVFGVILLGMIIERRRFLPEPTALCLNQFVYWIALPALIFDLTSRLHLEALPSGLIAALCISIALLTLLAYVLFSCMLHYDRANTAMRTLLATFPNTAFLGTPILLLIFPDSQISLVIMSLCAAIGGIPMCLMDSVTACTLHPARQQNQAGQLLLRSFLHNPLLIATITGFILAAAQWRLPHPVQVVTSMIGVTAAPCALLCMGMVLALRCASLQGFSQGWFRRQLPLHVLRLVIHPLLTLACLLILGIRGEILAVAVILSGMPIGVASYVVAEKHGIALEEASLGILINTLLSIFTLPIIIRTMQWLS